MVKGRGLPLGQSGAGHRAQAIRPTTDNITGEQVSYTRDRLNWLVPVESEAGKPMKMRKGLRRPVPWFVLSSLLLWTAADRAAAVKTFTSIQAGYVVDYPSEWRVQDRSLPTLYIVNFPASERVHAVMLPPGGASIAVVPPPSGVLDAEQWAARDLKPGMDVVSKANVVLRRRATGAPLDATEVDLTWDRPAPEFETLDCYFSISGHLFVGRLTFWKGDSKAAEYRQTLHEVVESLNLTGSGQKRRGP
jgi:hypothetical protein